MSPDHEEPRRWWQRIQWIDVVLVIVAVLALLALTAELWLPHLDVGPGR